MCVKSAYLNYFVDLKSLLMFSKVELDISRGAPKRLLQTKFSTSIFASNRTVFCERRVLFGDIFQRNGRITLS